MVKLQLVAKIENNLNEAIDTFLVDSNCREHVKDKKQVSNMNFPDSQCDKVFTSLSELLHHFKPGVKREVLKLDVNRSELSRMRLLFYKKAIKNQCEFRTRFEVKYNFSVVYYKYS